MEQSDINHQRLLSQQQDTYRQIDQRLQEQSKQVLAMGPAVGAITAAVAASFLRKVIQTGGRKIFPRTAEILNKNLGRNLLPREWGRALEELKNWERLPPKHHGKIYGNGNYADDAGRVLGNIDDFVK